MSRILPCPSCRGKLRVPDLPTGPPVQCPFCRHVFRLNSEPQPADLQDGPQPVSPRRRLSVYGLFAGLGLLVAGSIFFFEKGRKVWIRLGTATPRQGTPYEVVVGPEHRTEPIHLTDCRFEPWHVHRGEEGCWTDCWLLVAPSRQRGGKPPMWIVLHTTRVRNEEELRQFFSRKELTGVIFAVSDRLPADVLRELRQNHNELERWNTMVFEDGMDWPRWKITRDQVIGSGLLLAGLLCLITATFPWLRKGWGR